jgi:hypothetical protein
MLYMNMNGLVLVREKGEDESEIGENVRHNSIVLLVPIFFCKDKNF